VAKPANPSPTRVEADRRQPTLVQRGLTRIPKNLQLLPLAARTPPCARSLPATHRQPSSPLAAHHSAVSLVPVAPCWAFGLHSPVILLTLLLHFFLNTFFSLTGSIIDKFDIAARSHLGFHSFLPGPGCSTITLLSTSTIPTLTSRNPKTTEHPSTPDSIIRPRLPYPYSLPSKRGRLIFYLHIHFRSPGDEVIAVNHSAATSTQPSTFPFCTTNTRSHLDATLVDRTTYPTFQSTITQKTFTIYAQSSRPANPASERSAPAPLIHTNHQVGYLTPPSTVSSQQPTISLVEGRRAPYPIVSGP